MREKYCAQLLEELARTTKMELGPMMFKIYMNEFEKVGFEKIAPALEKCFLDLRKFPTCNEILEKCGMKAPDAQDEANMIVGKIVQCISEIGGYQPERAREKMGELAWATVKQFKGGWENLCMIDIDGTVRAQLRDTAKSIKAYGGSSLALESGSFDAIKFIEEASK